MEKGRKEDSKLSFWWFRAVDTNQYFDSFYILRKDSSLYLLRNCKYLVLSKSTGAVKSTWSLRKHYFIVKFWWKKKYSLIVKYQNILLSLCQCDTRDPNTWTAMCTWQNVIKCSSTAWVIWSDSSVPICIFSSVTLEN